MQQSGENRVPWVPLGAIMALAVVLRWLAFSPFDITHADELMQYLEQGHRLAFGHGLVPWEYRYGIRSLLVPELLAAPMLVARWFSDAPFAPLIAARMLFAALCLLAVPAAYWLGSLQSRLHGLVAMFVAAVWFEAVLLGVQVLTESLATASGCAGTAALLAARDNRRAALAAGFLLALTVLLRFHYAAYAGPLALMVLGRDRTAWVRAIIGGLPALALGAAIDLSSGMAPFEWAWRNVAMNIAEGRSAWFGVSDGSAYLHFIMGRMFPFALPIAALALLAGRRYWPVLAAAAINIAAHSLIAHKEYRFIWLSVFLIVVLAAIGSVNALERLHRDRGAAPARLPAGIALLCLAWAALSLATFARSGGTHSFRNGSQWALSAIEAAERPGTCGIGLPNWDIQHVGQAFLPRPVELYLLQDDLRLGRKPFPPEVAEAMNALVLAPGVRPPAAYRKVRCRDGAKGAADRACLWLRAGGCGNLEAMKGMTYQATLRAGDM